MTPVDAIILGIVQGLTEFLPISSSGHIELGSALLNVQSTNSLLFSVVVHAATSLSTIVVFRKDLIQLISELFQLKKEAVYYSGALILSAVPVGIIGLTYEKEIESFFSGQVLLVGFMLLVTGLLLALTYYSRPREGKVTLGRALLIGLSQALAILPGISRSGATISTALLLGVDKEQAARFSFLMVLIPILGGSALKLLDFLGDPSSSGDTSVWTLTFGFLAAFITGLVACKWMISIVKKGKLIYFAFYCFIVGSITILLTI
ncbi:MAG: undecaprenyl-diphosphatase [Cyclobacteriaceae bacterium]|nr:MAG: undecaprenyl-diphosphatase [Cyclobacteriaceae bacterium]